MRANGQAGAATCRNPTVVVGGRRDGAVRAYRTGMPLRVIARAGADDIAVVYLAEIDGRPIECVESTQPTLSREEKWVLMVSTLYGCPVGCAMCDAGGDYRGRIPAEGILAQIDHLVLSRYPDGHVPARKFKVQFARMGEPALNPAVLEVLRTLPGRYDAPGLMASLSTVAPVGAERFLEELISIKEELYGGGRFQLQFSIHTTDARIRDRLIPVGKWDLDRIGEYGGRFVEPGDRKVTLNFALPDGAPVDPEVMLRHFDPDVFLVKVTPLNPTTRAARNGLRSYVDPDHPGDYPVIDALRGAGYEVILSIGEVEENRIGSNCGQYVRRYLSERLPLDGAYEYRPSAPR